ncbi:hypothetical protein [Isoptericola rhizosphaerae]|uniref:hypothetical protein n=1 Tax=Isoptericola rhizosphaerae TaxID=3377837 RepID=UPI00383B612E
MTTNIKSDSNGDLTALVQIADLGGMDAGFEGILAVNPEGCLGLLPPDGQGEVEVVVWPAGTRLTDEGELRSPTGETFAVGDEFSAGGGILEDLRADKGDVVADCVADGEPGAVMHSVGPVGP